jgi:hypothetical protein
VSFGVKQPTTKLKRPAVYQRKEIVVKGSKPMPVNDHSQSVSLP